MHINEFIDTTAEVFVVSRDKVLLRKHEKYGLWLSVGGHQEPDEDPNETAVREVREEVGLEIKLFDPQAKRSQSADYTDLVPPRYMNRHRISNTHEHVTLVYFATASTQRLCRPDTVEGRAECRWFTIRELEQATSIDEHTKAYAREALRQLAGTVISPREYRVLLSGCH